MSKARRIAVIDCETDPFRIGRVPAPFVWGWYCSKLGFLHWWGPDATERFVEHLTEQNACVYAHNGGRFDFHYMSHVFRPGSRPLIINGRIAKIRVGKAELRDSWCIAPLPLSAIGAKLEIDYAKMEVGRREAHRAEILTYLEADCVELHRYVERFVGEHGRKLTIASAAMASWRAMDSAEIPKTTERYYQRIVPWYAGGRVEARESGVIKGPFQLVDINSAYPKAMLARHPYGGRAHFKRRGAELHPFDPKVRRFYRIEAEHGGCLWARKPSGGLSFEPGSGEFWATDWEVEAGLLTDSLHVRSVEETVTFDGVRSFSPYVVHWFAEKRRAEECGDAVGRVIAKLFLNSLYGKFGANPAKYREYMLDEIGWEEIADDAGAWLAGPELGEAQVYWRDLPAKRRRYYDVATSASITGYVRAQMWRSIHASERVVYCDTDSLIGSGLAVELGPEVGQWAVEVPRIDEIAIAGKKLYAAFVRGESVKQANKGVRISAEQIRAVAEGAVVVHASESPTYSFGSPPRFTERTVRATVGAGGDSATRTEGA